MFAVGVRQRLLFSLLFLPPPSAIFFWIFSKKFINRVCFFVDFSIAILFYSSSIEMDGGRGVGRKVSYNSTIIP